MRHSILLGQVFRVSHKFKAYKTRVYARWIYVRKFYVIKAIALVFWQNICLKVHDVIFCKFTFLLIIIIHTTHMLLLDSGQLFKRNSHGWKLVGIYFARNMGTYCNYIYLLLDIHTTLRFVGNLPSLLKSFYRIDWKKKIMRGYFSTMYLVFSQLLKSV